MKNCEEKPRWPGSPPYCVVAQKLRFDSPKEAKDFLEANAPGASLLSVDQCKACGGFHSETRMREASGASSGSGTRYLTRHLSLETQAIGQRLSERSAREFNRQPSDSNDQMALGKRKKTVA